MEELESPTEQAQEDMHEHAHHSSERWILWVALSSALLAAFAAVTVLLAAHHADEGMSLQIRSSDLWNEYQAKRTRSDISKVKDELLAAASRPIPAEDTSTLQRREDEENELKAEANSLMHEATAHRNRHEPLALGVTMFQVAIAVGAISVLSKRPSFWYVSMGFGLVGVFFLFRGVI